MSGLAIQTTTSRPHYGLGNEHPITEKNLKIQLGFLIG